MLSHGLELYTTHASREEAESGSLLRSHAPYTQVGVRVSECYWGF